MPNDPTAPAKPDPGAEVAFGGLLEDHSKGWPHHGGHHTSACLHDFYKMGYRTGQEAERERLLKMEKGGYPSLAVLRAENAALKERYDGLLGHCEGCGGWEEADPSLGDGHSSGGPEPTPCGPMSEWASPSVQGKLAAAEAERDRLVNTLTDIVCLTGPGGFYEWGEKERLTLNHVAFAAAEKALEGK